MSRDTVRGRVVAAAALHLQLHGLPDRIGQRFRAEHAGAYEGFPDSAGQPKGWRRQSPSGADVTSWFCGECGARLYGERQGRPQIMNLRAGTLDDTSWLTPLAHFYTGSAQAWVQPATGAERHELQPADFSALMIKWRRCAGILP